MAKDKTKKKPPAPAAKKPAGASQKPPEKAVAKKPAAKPKAAPKPPAAKPAPPMPDEPKDIFALVADCSRLYHNADDAKKLEVCSLFPAVSAVVAGYAAGLAIPTTKALQPLRDFRYFFLPRMKVVIQDDTTLTVTQTQPAPVDSAETVPAAVTNAPVAAKPWEPVPPSIQRLLDGTSPDAEHGTWQTGGIVWEYYRGWPEPRPTGEHVVSEYASTVDLLASANQERQQDPDNPDFGPPLDFAEPTDDEKEKVLAETGPAALGTKPVTLPLNEPVPHQNPPVTDPTDDDPNDPLNMDGQEDYEPTREELEEEERQREREEAETAREEAAGKRKPAKT